MPIRSKISTPIPANQQGAVDLTSLIGRIGAGPTAEALRQVQTGFNTLTRALRTPQSVEEFEVTEPSGRQIFWVGSRVVNNAVFRGFWSQEGYLGGTSADDAPLYADENGLITFTLGGADDAAAIVVLDENGNEVVRIGKINTTPDEYGIYARAAKIGGPDVDNPIIFADSQGLVTINGGSIRIGPGASGLGGTIDVYDASDALIATLGMYDAVAAVAVSTTNAGTVTTSAAHGLVANDYTRLVGNTTAAHNRIWKVVTAPTSTTFTVTGMTGTGTGGTSTKQSAGKWSMTDRIGGTSPSTAKVIADASGNVSISDATVTINGSGYTITISAADGVKVQNVANESYSRLQSGYLEIIGTGASAVFTANYNDSDFLISRSGSSEVYAEVRSTGSMLRLKDQTGATAIELDGSSGSTGVIINGSLRINGTTTIDGSRNATLASLDLTTALAVSDGGTGATDATTARSNLSVYSIAQVDALLAAKANSAHTHNTIAIATTAGGGVAAHTHTGSVT